MTTIAELKQWFENGVKSGARYMIVACDTFDHTDYPVYIKEIEDFWAKHAEHNNSANMRRVMEVYDLDKSWAEQATGRVFNTPPKVT